MSKSWKTASERSVPLSYPKCVTSSASTCGAVCNSVCSWAAGTSTVPWSRCVTLEAKDDTDYQCGVTGQLYVLCWLLMPGWFTNADMLIVVDLNPSGEDRYVSLEKRTFSSKFSVVLYPARLSDHNINLIYKKLYDVCLIFFSAVVGP